MHTRAQELMGNGLMALHLLATNDVVLDSDINPTTNMELLGTCLMDMAKEVMNHHVLS